MLPMPIQGTNPPVCLPEPFGREVYAAYVRALCKGGGAQSYERIVERGGFGLLECVFCLYGKWPKDDGFEGALLKFFSKAMAAGE